MKNKLLIAALSVFAFANTYAQEENAKETQISEIKPESDKKLYIKGNALFIPIGIINLGVEKQISKKITVQGDVLISPWKSFAGHEAQVYMVSVSGRYYFKEAFKGWYLGANVAFATFSLQKPNYWNDNNYVNPVTLEVTKHVNSNLYQKGFTFIAGIEGGYQFKLSENWNMDIFAGIGTSQDSYKGYDRTTGERYDEVQNGYNRSGEIIPYRGGVMISYRLK